MAPRLDYAGSYVAMMTPLLVGTLSTRRIRRLPAIQPVGQGCVTDSVPQTSQGSSIRSLGEQIGPDHARFALRGGLRCIDRIDGDRGSADLRLRAQHQCSCLAHSPDATVR